VSVQDVIPNTVAETQGLQAGDLITQFGDHVFKAEETMEDAWKIFRLMAPGQKIKLKIHRDTGDVEVNLTVGEKPEAYRNTALEEETNEALWEKYRKGELKPEPAKAEETGKPAEPAKNVEPAPTPAR
jgi:C-terminal processing protease CtpA/Prc